MYKNLSHSNPVRNWKEQIWKLLFPCGDYCMSGASSIFRLAGIHNFGKKIIETTFLNQTIGTQVRLRLDFDFPGILLEQKIKISTISLTYLLQNALRHFLAWQVWILCFLASNFWPLFLEKWFHNFPISASSLCSESQIIFIQKLSSPSSFNF